MRTAFGTETICILGDSDGGTRVPYASAYTVRAADDPGAAGRVLHVKPPANTMSHNELLPMWGKKAGRAFRRVYVAEDAVLKMIRCQDDSSLLNAYGVRISYEM